jgi:hypothetical protein
VPIILSRPQALLDPRNVLGAILGALRSATFLTTFVTSYWYSVCVTRSLVFARLFPFVSHDFWDGPYGGVLAGCLVCGSSIWIENGRRRGEMALYVLPRAVRACLPDAWVRGGNAGVRLAERLVAVVQNQRVADHHLQYNVHSVLVLAFNGCQPSPAYPPRAFPLGTSFHRQRTNCSLLEE